MKKVYILALLNLFFNFGTHAQVAYSGNNHTGFGGTLGDASLTINDDGTALTFNFSKGASGTLDNIVVIYIDSKTGGHSDTTNFTDEGDSARKAVSTKSGSNSPTVTFPSGFTADYAVAFDSSGSWIFELNTGTHTYIDIANITPTGNNAAATHTLTLDFAEIGITAGQNFKFVATYISNTAYLSNEVIGDTSSIDPDGGGTNPGFTGTITFSGNRSYPNTWTGATDSNWAAANNWSEGVPTTTHNVYIPKVSNQPTAASAITIQKATLASGASLIAQNTFTGAVTYNRTLSSNNWYLVSSPVAGETLEGLISNHTFATGSGGNIGIAPYANDGSAWDYQTTAATGSLASGSGYSVKLAAAGAISFNGTFPATDVSIGITHDANGLNLVGNPYPSYIAANSSADAVNNLLTINSTTLSEETLWFWDSGSNSYVTYNQASSSKFVSPAQGFFVNSNGTNSFQFTEAMQSHQSSDSFQRTTATRPEINLMLSNDTDTRSTDIFFIEGTTTGWDNGYDSSIFGGTANSFAIYTHLVSESEGQNLGIQSLPETDLESMIIPVGINAVSGTEITISLATQNLPEGIDVYLEDKVVGSFTRLAIGENYDMTLSEALNGIGRYYLHTSAQVLGTDDLMHANISIYTINENSIRIVGVQNGAAKVRVYSVLGKQVHTTSFQGNGMNDVDLPKVAKGVYLIQLETEIGILNKKIIIE